MAQNHNIGFGNVRYFYRTEPNFGSVRVRVRFDKVLARVQSSTNKIAHKHYNY